MSDSSLDKDAINIFPYDFVKENEVIATKSQEGYEVISPNKISLSSKRDNNNR